MASNHRPHWIYSVLVLLAIPAFGVAIWLYKRSQEGVSLNAAGSGVMWGGFLAGSLFVALSIYGTRRGRRTS